MIFHKSNCGKITVIKGIFKLNNICQLLKQASLIRPFKRIKHLEGFSEFLVTLSWVRRPTVRLIMKSNADPAQLINLNSAEIH